MKAKRGSIHTHGVVQLSIFPHNKHPVRNLLLDKDLMYMVLKGGYASKHEEHDLQSHGPLIN